MRTTTVTTITILTMYMVYVVLGFITATAGELGRAAL